MQEKIYIKNPKGQNISAVIHRPETKTQKLAILCPGFFDSKDYLHLVELANRLSEIGYTTVRFDPTGTWESEGTEHDYSSSQYLDDIQAVKDYMLKDGDYKFILLGGHSRGGRMALLHSSKDKDISVVVGIMPSAVSKPRHSESNERAKKLGYKIVKQDIPGSEQEYKEYKYPYHLVLDSYNFSVLDAADKISSRIILIAGEEDMLIPVEEVKSIFDKAKKPKKLIVIPGTVHHYRHNPEEIRKVNEIILENL